jgi:hypothetical protein
VLLPVAVLVRRTYAAEQIWATFMAGADGFRASPDRYGAVITGGDGAGLAVPGSRAAGGGPGVVVDTGGDHRGDVTIRDKLRCGWRDAVVAGGDRDGADRVAARCGRVAGRGDAGAGSGAGSSAWLLAPGRPPPRGWLAATRIAPMLGPGDR